MTMTQFPSLSSSCNLNLFDTNMQLVQAGDFDEWLSTKEGRCETSYQLQDFLTMSSSIHSHESIGELSVVTINTLDEDFEDEENLLPKSNKKNSGNKKRVSWGDKVQIREYQVIQGDHPNCKLPLSLAWDVTNTSERDLTVCSPERRAHYRAPRRLSLEDRRERLYGDVQSNLADFAITDNSLEELMKGLDDLLNEATIGNLPPMPQIPVATTTTTPTFALPPMPSYDDFRSYDCTPMPESLAAYEEFFATPPELPDAPIVHWTRVASAC